MTQFVSVKFMGELRKEIEKPEGSNMRCEQEAFGGRLRIETLRHAGKERPVVLARLGQIFDEPDDLTRAFFLRSAQSPGIGGAETPADIRFGVSVRKTE